MRTSHQETHGGSPIPPPPSAPPPSADLQIVRSQPRTAAAVAVHRVHRPYASGLTLADRRGLTGVGATTLIVAVAALAGAVDGHRAGNGLGWIFGVTFVVCCLAAALLAHHEDMAAVAILPPLAFLVGALACAAFRPSVVGVPFTSQLRNELLIAMLIGAPSLFVAEAVTLVTTGLRGLRYRSVQRPRSH